MDEPRTRRPAMSETTYRLLILGAVIVAFVALGVGYRATRTGSPEDRHAADADEAVESVFPSQGDQVLRQTEVGIDLASGYDAALQLNGTAIPRGEQRRVAAQNQVFFKPGPGKVVEELPAGQSCVVATVWKISDGRGEGDQSLTWCFTAA